MRSRKRPETITFFLDRSLGKGCISDALKTAGARVVVHDDLFPQNAPDEKWLPVAGTKRWVVLTQDFRIRYRTLQKQAIERTGARVFVLVSKHLTGEQMARTFTSALPGMEDLARSQGGPFIAKVYRDGKILMWTDFK